MNPQDTMLLTFDEFEDLRAALPPRSERASVVRLAPVLRIQRIQASRPHFERQLLEQRKNHRANAS